MKHVFSTFATDVTYVAYLDGPPGGLPTIGRRVTIKGGAGVADKHTITRPAIMNEVSDDDFEFLLKDPQFQKHTNNGFIRYSARKTEVETIAKDMNPEDGCRPLTGKDYENGGRAFAIVPGMQLKPPTTHKVA